jgi:hypothetical protein
LRGLGAADGEGNVTRRQRAAIVEIHARAPAEFPGERINGAPGFREARLGAELRVLSGALRGDVAATLDLARCTGPRGALLRGVFRAAAERPDVPAGGVAEMRAI